MRSALFPCRRLTCLVCFDEYAVLKGLECGSGEGGSDGGEGGRGMREPSPLSCEECVFEQHLPIQPNKSPLLVHCLHECESV